MWQTMPGVIQKIWWDIENKTDVSKAPRSEAKVSATEKLRRGRERGVMYLRTRILSTWVIREEIGILSIDSNLS